MSQQVPEDVDALWDRLKPVFDDTPRIGSKLPPTSPAYVPPDEAIESAKSKLGWPKGGMFGDDIPDVKTVVVHFTAGWPTKSVCDSFRKRYTDDTADDPGIGPHLYMPYDGTVFRLLTETLHCSHAGHVNSWAIGVETGNLADQAPPTAGSNGPWSNKWTQLSAHAEDLPGAKFYAVFKNQEILVALWSTNAQGALTDSSGGRPMMMLPSEAQYRSWALLARWLAERWRVPRNFPLHPNLSREKLVKKWRLYRAIVDADPVRDVYIRTQLQPAPHNCSNAVFISDNLQTGLPHVYLSKASIKPVEWETTTIDKKTKVKHKRKHKKEINDLWTRLFNSYRGFHGHGYSGSNKKDDHNCPGPLFDWHRFAREVWDYWWYPFDLTQQSPGTPIASGKPRRVYGHGDGILYEHYFDEDAALYAQVSPSGCFPVGDETVAQHPLPGHGGLIQQLVRMTDRYWGFWHGGMHFEIAASSPIYAAGAGQLVAARLHTGDDQYKRHDPASPYPSALFVLLRHEVFHHRAANGARIDYKQEPTRVYSLYMHLGAPKGLNLHAVAEANPTWLNRVLAMKTEYDLGLAFQTAHANPAPQWRPHTTRWNRQKPLMDQALADLSAGKVARFPEGEDAIRVALGDFLGIAGHMNRQRFGIHLEVFSRDPIKDPWFEQVDQSGTATRPYHDETNLEDVSKFLRGHIPKLKRPYDAAERYRDMPAQQRATLFQGVALRSKSEWALKQADFPSGNWAPAQALMWWPDVVPAMNQALAANAPAQLPADGVVWHYHPLGFMAWLNGVTWRSEWPKYRITDARGQRAPDPGQPRRRR